MILALLRDRRAITSVEFAFVAPVMFLFITGGIEAGHVMMARTTLEAGLRKAARYATVNLATADDDRFTQMKAIIDTTMAGYPKPAGRDLTISTTVYENFSKTLLEPFEDVNGNGSYDGPVAGVGGEPFDDRNRNGVRDVAQSKAGKLGGPGDVVSYSATFPIAFWFGFLEPIFGSSQTYAVRATMVIRNEPAVRTTAATVV
jgi:Flp pilus assembly protein TadG